LSERHAWHDVGFMYSYSSNGRVTTCQSISGGGRSADAKGQSALWVCPLFSFQAWFGCLLSIADYGSPADLCVTRCRSRAKVPY